MAPNRPRCSRRRSFIVTRNGILLPICLFTYGYLTPFCYSVDILRRCAFFFLRTLFFFSFFFLKSFCRLDATSAGTRDSFLMHSISLIIDSILSVQFIATSREIGAANNWPTLKKKIISNVFIDDIIRPPRINRTSQIRNSKKKIDLRWCDKILYFLWSGELKHFGVSLFLTTMRVS